MAERTCRRESEEQAAGDNLILQCGGEIVSFSQPRRTMQTEGIADRRYRCHGVLFWWEWKAEDGGLSAEQYRFLARELHDGNPVGCGTLEDLMRYLPHLRQQGRHGGVQWGATLLQQWAAKGIGKARSRRRKDS